MRATDANQDWPIKIKVYNHPNYNIILGGTGTPDCSGLTPDFFFVVVQGSLGEWSWSMVIGGLLHAREVPYLLYYL